MSAQPAQKGSSGSGDNAADNLHRMESILFGFLDRLDADQSSSSGTQRGKRLSYRRNDLRLTVTHPGGGTAARTVLGRDLCPKGAGIVYDGFLYIGTDCMLILRRRMTGQDVVRGQVVHCRHLHGAYHLVEIEFREPIVPKLYVEASEWNKLSMEGEVDPATVVGTVLMLDDQKIDHTIAAHCLRGSGIKLTSVASTAEALAAVKQMKIDLVLTDLNLDKGERGEQVIVKLREVGYRGSIIVVSAEGNADRIAGAWAAGANALLPKPYTKQQLLNSISNLLTVSTEDSDLEPIFSTLFASTSGSRAAYAETATLIEQFLDGINDALFDLKRAIAEDAIQNARTVCQTLKGTGLSYGFPAITDAAKEAVRSLDATQSIDESLTELRRVESIALRLRPGAKK